MKIRDKKFKKMMAKDENNLESDEFLEEGEQIIEPESDDSQVFGFKKIKTH